jgi:hypothetical protein
LGTWSVTALALHSLLVQPQVAAEGGKKRLVSSSKLTGGFYSTGQPCSRTTFLRNVSGHGDHII